MPCTRHYNTKCHTLVVILSAVLAYDPSVILSECYHYIRLALTSHHRHPSLLHLTTLPLSSHYPTQTSHHLHPLLSLYPLTNQSCPHPNITPRSRHPLIILLLPSLLPLPSKYAPATLPLSSRYPHATSHQPSLPSRHLAPPLHYTFMSPHTTLTTPLYVFMDIHSTLRPHNILIFSLRDARLFAVMRRRSGFQKAT